MGRFLFALLYAGLAVADVSGAQSDPAADTTETRPLSWSLIPIVFSSPDTDWAFGVLPQVVFQLPGTQRRSRIYVAAYYTLNKQYAVSSAGSFWFNDDRDNLEVAANVKYWPTTFYGLVSRPGPFDPTDYTERSIGLSVSGSRQLGSTFRIGLKGSVQRIRILESDTDTLSIKAASVPGLDGGWAVGIGPSIGIDTRDQVFYPTRGWFVDLSFTSRGIPLGGDYDFTSVEGDIRTYRNTVANHVLAAQAVFSFNSKAIPFWGMRGIGSVVRGFSSMQFIDRDVVAAHVEYRIHPVIWRLGLVVFTGAGVAAGRIGDLPSARIRWASGFGIRIAFMRADQINIRWDFGWGEGKSGDYLEMGEAF